jgi:hypothetical protein
LLTRNLQDLFGGNNPARRRAAIDELYTEDGVFYDPNKRVYRGRDEIKRIAGVIRATHSEFRYQPIAAPEEAGNGGRVQWVEAALMKRQPMPEPISSLPVMAGSLPCIFYSTSCPDFDSAQVARFSAGSAERGIAGAREARRFGFATNAGQGGGLAKEMKISASGTGR